MEYFKITLKPHKAVKNADYVESLIWESFSALQKTGQVYDHFQIVRETASYAVYVIMPGADSLNLEFCSDETVESVKKLAAIFSLRVDSLGTTITCDDSCLCEAPTWYMLYTDMAMQESPIVCGDCGKPVPVYKLPTIADGEGRSVLLAWQEQFRAIQTLDMDNYNAEFTAAEIYTPASRLNKMGRGLCRALEKAKEVPVFYHMEQTKAAASETCPVCGNAWSRTANPEVAGKLCTFCRLAVD